MVCPETDVTSATNLPIGVQGELLIVELETPSGLENWVMSGVRMIQQVLVLLPEIKDAHVFQHFRSQHFNIQEMKIE